MTQSLHLVENPTILTQLSITRHASASNLLFVDHVDGSESAVHRVCKNTGLEIRGARYVLTLKIPHYFKTSKTKTNPTYI